MSRRRGNDRGFTLIEIVVALLVLALASAAIFEGFSTGFRSSRTANDFAEAVLIAQAKLAPVGVAEPLAAGVTTGEEGDKFAWTVHVDPVDAPVEEGARASSLQPFLVAVDVTWSDGGAERTVSLSTLRLASQ